MKCRNFGTYRAIRDVTDLLTKGRLYYDCYLQIMNKKWGDDETSRCIVVTTDDGVSRGINEYYLEPVEITNDIVYGDIT